MRVDYGKLAKTLPRPLAALAAAGAISGFAPWETAAALPAAASPWTALCAAIAARRVTLLTLAALPLLLLALGNGRWFCRALCPTGWLLRTAEWRRPVDGRLLRRVPALGKWLALAGLGGALAGWPLFIQADPLVIFTGFFSAWRGAGAGPQWRTAAAMLILLATARIWPWLWCARLCPLGACLEGCGGLGKRWRRASVQRPAAGGMARRNFLAAMGGFTGGLALGGGMRLWNNRHPALLRPPGAGAGINALCARCGNCLRVCPTRIIRPATLQAGVGGLLTPVLDFTGDYCHADCHACTLVCPTGAIPRVTLERKQNLAIGVAQVGRELCYGWKHGLYCLICEGVCPYAAIDTVQHAGVDCPRVMPHECRGCGACQTHCPVKPRPAIKVMPRT